MFQICTPVEKLEPKEFKAGTSREIYTPMFNASLFIIAKMWTQPKCPWVGEWINKMWHVHKIEYYSALRKEMKSLAKI